MGTVRQVKTAARAASTAQAATSESKPVRRVGRKSQESVWASTSHLRLLPVGSPAEVQAERMAQEAQQPSGRDTAATAAATPLPPPLRSPVIPGGQPLAPHVGAAMGAQFGADFGTVRVHVGEDSERLARVLRARALTMGEHLFFGQGAYEPASSGGRRLLAHELAHVVQQRREARAFI